jgi:hypothetical protein
MNDVVLTRKREKRRRSITSLTLGATPDQLRRLRRTTLLNARPLPREISGEPA